jgi:hypothetical protein
MPCAQNKTVRVTGNSTTLESSFDHVFDQQESQADVYSRVQGIALFVVSQFDSLECLFDSLSAYSWFVTP